MKENGGGERKAGVGGMDGATRNAFCQCTNAKKARAWDEDAKSQSGATGACVVPQNAKAFASWDKSAMKKRVRVAKQA